MRTVVTCLTVEGELPISFQWFRENIGAKARDRDRESDRGRDRDRKCVDLHFAKNPNEIRAWVLYKKSCPRKERKGAYFRTFS